MIFFLLHFHYTYNDTTSRHLFWHPAYSGLFAHPDGKSKYGYDQATGDTYNFHLVENITYERYGTKNWETIGGYELFESILKDEYIKFMVQNPSYFIKNYLYKPILFIKSYFGSTGYNASNYLFNWTILCVVLIGSLLAGDIFLKLWFQYFFILVLGLAFALLPSMVYVPLPPWIADPALLFTILIYMMISGALCYAAQYLRLRFAKTEKLQHVNVN